MVLPSSTAAQSEAAEADWLTELRRWLTLGHKGVIVMIRDAQRARLRELVLMLDEIEPGFCFDTDAAVITDAAPGSLVLLGVQREQLDWLNLNRPLFAERSLRVVLWAEDDLAVDLKFRAPDLHDWVSHFVTCPPGVPEFAIEGLRQGIGSWPGVAWTGPGLELALAKVPETHPPIELNLGQDYPHIIKSLEAHDGGCVIWKNAQTFRHLWRARLASAEAEFAGTNILDNPSIATPGWHRASSIQLNLHDAAATFQGVNRYRNAALVELDPEAISPADPITTNGDIARVTSQAYHTIESIVRSGAGDRAWAIVAMVWLGQSDIAAHWQARWNIADATLQHRVDPPLISMLSLSARVIGERTLGELPEFLEREQGEARRLFGASDPQYLHLSRLIGLLAGIHVSPSLAHDYFAPLNEAAAGRDYPLLAGVELEHSVVQAMLGRYEAALAQFEAAPTTDADYPSFERFHQLTRAALGQIQLEDADTSPLSSQIEARGRALLRSRLERLRNP